MKLSPFRPVVSWLLLGLAALDGCGRATHRAPFDLPIYFTCDTRGRLEPCGCFTGQFGGLTRLKTVLDEEAPDSAVRLDVGDAIGGHEDYDLIEYQYLLQAFATMKYDALNAGHREAQLSADQLKEIKRTSPVSFVSANLLEKASGKPVFDPYKIIERGGYRIALIGLIEPRGLSEDLGPGLAVGELESTLSQQLTALRSKADVIIVLAFTDEAGLSRLAQQFYEVQVFLGGKVSQPAQELKRENRSLIYYVTNESRALGILQLGLLENSGPRVVKNEIRLLHDKIPQAASFRELAQKYREQIRHTKLRVDDPANSAADMVPGVRAAADYVGSERCVACHQSAGAVWAKSDHARAFAILKTRKADADPKCIGCHTTGFGAISGYRRELGAEKLVHVGCESCHGPGSLHVRQQEGDKSVSFKYRPLGSGDCQKCHYGEFSRPFLWHEFWPAIRHGKEPDRADDQHSKRSG